MLRLVRTAALATTLTAALATTACATSPGATNPGATNPGATNPGATNPAGSPGPSASPTGATLAPSLVERLPHLPADQPVRLVVTLAPGTPTDRLRTQVEALGGHLLQRFTLIEAAVVAVPGAQVPALARLPEVRGVELADSGVPPP